MLSALHGRINRKTFIVGNLVAFVTLLLAMALIVVPLAIVDLALAGRGAVVFDVLYKAVVFPALLYFFYFVMLMVKRAHDFGWPGLLITFIFIALFILAHLFDLFWLNLIAIAIFLFFCVKAGDKARNHFGPAPRKQFRFDNLKVTF